MYITCDLFCYCQFSPVLIRAFEHVSNLSHDTHMKKWINSKLHDNVIADYSMLLWHTYMIIM